MSCRLLKIFMDALGDKGLFKSRVLLTMLLLLGTIKDDDELIKLYFCSSLLLACETFVHKPARERAACIFNFRGTSWQSSSGQAMADETTPLLLQIFEAT